MLLLALLAGHAGADLAGLAGLRTFGGSTGSAAGITAHVFTTNETNIFSYNVSSDCASSSTCAAQTTFLWTTGGKERHGRFINDNIILRYYIDGAPSAQLQFFQGAAAGSFVNLESLSYYLTQYNSTTGSQGQKCSLTKFDPYCGMDLADSNTNDGTFQPWMSRWAGKNGAEGNWVNHFRIPFYRSLRVTAQIDPSRPAEIFPNSTSNMFALIRGVEGDSATLAGMTQLGGAALPPLKQYDVQLRQLRNTGTLTKLYNTNKL